MCIARFVKMAKPRKSKVIPNLLVLAIILAVIKSTVCRRPSFKDSLTAYAEDKTPSTSEARFRVQGEITRTQGTQTDKIIPQNHIISQSGGGNNKVKTHSGQETWHLTSNHPSVSSERQSNVMDQYPLWRWTKPFPFSLQLQQIVANYEKAKNALSEPKDHVASESLSRAEYRATAKNKNSTFVPMNGSLFKAKNNSVPRNVQAQAYKNAADLMDQYQNQPRNKKEIAGNTGLRGLIWNTATALTSVNKEHFLPTFLHTKTGGKLSLVRDSIFKPVTILSQFKSGVQEINNEKIKSLSRLSTGGYGWGWRRPISEVLVVRPYNSHAWTLARYIFRLTKHTVITKWKLKRALLDLQIRAVKKLIRILNSKTLAQKLAVIRILTGAAWKGKKAILRLLAGPPKTTTTPSTVLYYSGKDNAANVDITYESLNKYNNQEWMNYVTPPRSTPPPSPVAMPLKNYYNAPQKPSYNPPEYKPQIGASIPVSPNQGLPPQPNTMFVPPDPPQQPAANNYYPLTVLSSFMRTAGMVSSSPDPLIEQPSYAHVLKTMGINPTNYDTQDNVKSSTPSTMMNLTNNVIQDHTQSTSSTITTIGSTNSILTSPNPTVVYFTSMQTENTHNQQSVTNEPNIPTVERPTMSYSYHSSYMEPSSATNKMTTPYHLPETTPSMPFGMKLLGAMSLGTSMQGVKR